MYSNRGFYRKAYQFSHSFKNSHRMGQAGFSANSFSLNMAQNTLYCNQIRVQSTLLVPMNMRLQMLNGVALSEEDTEETIVEDCEEDTL
jgi:hypothetical protein